MGLSYLKEFIDEIKSYVCDHLIFLFIVIYCYDTKLSEEKLNVLIELLDNIRSKYPAKQKKLPPFIKDTFKTDFKKSVRMRRKQKE